VPRKKKIVIEIKEHVLMPEHSKLNDKEKKELFEKYGVALKEMPKILITDPAIQKLAPKQGDVIKISRPSPTAGQTVFYRGVINA
jgi:DNA-directed RNA polymerase subunit H (RpoH/RPB5)